MMSMTKVLGKFYSWMAGVGRKFPLRNWSIKEQGFHKSSILLQNILYWPPWKMIMGLRDIEGRECPEYIRTSRTQCSHICCTISQESKRSPYVLDVRISKSWLFALNEISVLISHYHFCQGICQTLQLNRCSYKQSTMTQRTKEFEI